MLYITPRRLMHMMGVTQDIPSFITVLHAVAAMWAMNISTPPMLFYIV